MKRNMNDKKLVLTISIILLLVIFFPLVTSQIDRQTHPLPLDNSNWWNTSWPYRKLITIDHTQVNSPLTNFPVLIYRSSDADVATKAQINGQDILFILYSDNTTKLNHEIESYSTADGNLVAWVNVTSVSSTADTKLWMYYGNSGANDQQNIEGTWDAHYVYVQHLNETSGPIYDSTQYNNDGTSYGSMNRSAPGKIDGGYYFDRIDDYVDSTNSSSLYNAMKNAFTVEAWTKTNNFGNWRSTVTKDRTGTGKTSEFWFGWANNNKLDFKFNAATDRYGNTTITDTNWHYIVGNYNGTSMRLYLDGTPDNTPVSVAKVTPSNGSVNLGLTKYWGDNSYGGTLDEVRISDIARNNSWQSTSYNNQNNPVSFLSIGAEEPYEYTLTLTTSGTGSGTIQASPNGPYYYGTTVTIWANASIGSTFAGFTGSLTGTTTPQVLTFDGDENVDAQFTLNGPYTLTLTTSGTGSGTIQASPTGPYYYGTTITIYANATTGSIFTGFTGDLTGIISPQILIMDNNKAVDAQFTLNGPFTLTLTTSGTGTGTIEASPGLYYYGDTATIWANASIGSTFTGFTGDLAGTTTPQILTFDGDENVDAAFTLNGPYTLTLTTSGTGSGTIEANPGPYYYGSTITIWANASIGSTFAGFTGSLTGTTTPQVLTFDGDENVDAQFTLNGPYTLTLTTSGTGTGTIETSPGPYYYGDTATIWANTTTGSTFTGFTGALTGTDTPQILTMDNDKTVDAQFTLNGPYTLTLTTSGTGSGTIEASPTGPYYYGTIVTIYANATTGSAFTGFTGDLTGTTTPQTLFIDGNKTVNAQFTQLYKLTIHIQGSGTVAKDPDQPFYWYGQVVTLTAIPATWWNFGYWDGDLSGNTNPRTITMDKDKSVLANFSQWNHIPLPPDRPNGETSGIPGVEYNYTTVATDQDGDQLYYQFNWGNGGITEWYGPYNSGEVVNKSHIWTWKGIYFITVRAKDIYGAESDWSIPLRVTMPLEDITSQQGTTLNKVLQTVLTFTQTSMILDNSQQLNQQHTALLITKN
jgi:hypothetical protein